MQRVVLGYCGFFNGVKAMTWESLKSTSPLFQGNRVQGG
jgi:hypothetical protein